MRPERRLAAGMAGGPEGRPLKRRRVGLICGSVSGEAGIRFFEQLQLVQQTDPIPSCERSVAGEVLNLIFVVDAGFDLNQNYGNPMFMVIPAGQDGTARQSEIKRAAVLSFSKVEVEDRRSAFHISFGCDSPANAWRCLPRGHCDWSPKIWSLGCCVAHQFCLKYRINWCDGD